MLVLQLGGENKTCFVLVKASVWPVYLCLWSLLTHHLPDTSHLLAHGAGERHKSGISCPGPLKNHHFGQEAFFYLSWWDCYVKTHQWDHFWAPQLGLQHASSRRSSPGRALLSLLRHQCTEAAVQAGSHGAFSTQLSLQDDINSCSQVEAAEGMCANPGNLTLEEKFETVKEEDLLQPNWNPLLN